MMRYWIVAVAATLIACGGEGSASDGCPGAQLTCNGDCVDLATNESHCGECGRTCSNGVGCFAGACTSPAALPQPRVGHGAATLPDGRIAIVAGSTTVEPLPEYLTALHAYDPTINAWSELTQLPTPRSYAGVGQVQDGLLVAGGIVVVKEGDTFLARVKRTTELYVPAEDTWSLAPDLIEPRSDAPVIGTSNGRAFAIWGWKDQSTGASTTLDSIEVREPSSPWILNATAADPPRWAARAVVSEDGKIYLLGGFVVPPPAFPWNPTRRTVAYDATTDAWVELAPSQIAHGLGAATRGPDGRIYYIGGIDESMHTHAEVEVYDPTTNLWSFVAPLPLTLQDAAAATGSNGRIYVMGGVQALDSTTPLDVMFVYDPVQDVWYQ